MDDRQTSAVLAYCRELGTADKADDVVKRVAAAIKSGKLEADAGVLPLTREIAGSYMDTAPLTGEWRRLLETVREERASRAFVATLAAAAPAEAPPAPLLAPPAPPDAPPASLPAPPASLPAPPASLPAPPASLPAPLQEPRRFPDEPPPAEEPPTVEHKVLPGGQLPALADQRAARARSARRGLVIFPATAADPAETSSPVEPAAARRARPAAPRAVRAGRDRPVAGVGLVAAMLSEYRVFLTTLGAGAVVVVIVALLIGGPSSSPAASLPPPAPDLTQAPVGAPVAGVRTHHRAHRAHRRLTTRTTYASAPATSTTTTPASSTAPPAQTGTSSHTSSGGGVVATEQNGSLPAQSAPTQTVGSGGATTTTGP